MRIGFSVLARQTPALWLAVAGGAGAAVDLSSYYIDNPHRLTVAGAIGFGIEVLLKVACLILFPLCVFHLLSAFSKARRLLVVGVTWATMLVLLTTALAICRQPLVLLNAHNPSVRYVPGNGYSPDIGLRYVTPPGGMAGGAEWVSENPDNVVGEWYRKEWRSGRIYLREVALALLMAFGWIGIGRLFRNRMLLFIGVSLFTAGLLIAAQTVNHYLIWDYDIFLLGIWSDSLLMDMFSLVFPTGSSTVSFAFAGTVGVGSLLSMRWLMSRNPSNADSTAAPSGSIPV